MTPEEFTDTCPAFGFTLPVIAEHIRDGDTLTVRVPAGHVWAVRVLGLWCPEKHTDYGKLAKEACRQLIEKSPQLAWHIPLPSDAVHLAKLFSFDRIPSSLWLTGTISLRDKMIDLGYGFADKPCQKIHEERFAAEPAYRERMAAYLDEGLEL